jgi:hypothetical protein
MLTSIKTLETSNLAGALMRHKLGENFIGIP